MSEDTTTSTENVPAPEAVADGVKTFSLEYVQQLRQEAASHRTSKNEAVEAAKTAAAAEFEAKLAAKDLAYTELQNQLGDAWIELEKFATAVEAKVPSDKVLAFVKVLQGTDKESITESAKSSLELFGPFDAKTPAFDPSQGLGGKPTLALNGDPILEAITRIVGAR